MMFVCKNEHPVTSSHSHMVCTALGSGTAIILGTIVGGMVTAKLAKTTARKAKVSIVVGTITTLTIASMIAFGCGPTNIAGQATEDG